MAEANSANGESMFRKWIMPILMSLMAPMILGMAAWLSVTIKQIDRNVIAIEGNKGQISRIYEEGTLELKKHLLLEAEQTSDFRYLQTDVSEMRHEVDTMASRQIEQMKVQERQSAMLDAILKKLDERP